MAISFELKPRIWRDNAIALGPGKADLLDAIAQTGSISAAARAILAGVGKYALIPLDHFPTMEAPLSRRKALPTQWQIRTSLF